jgi:hypothetical protein
VWPRNDLCDYDVGMKAPSRLLKLGVAALLVFSQSCLHASDKAPKPDKELARYAGEYSGETRTKTESLSQSEMQEYSLKHHSINLSLGADGSATVSQSPTGEDEITTFGHFKVSGGQLTITFDPSPDGKGTPAPMVFSTGHNELTPVAYDHSLWPKLPPPPMHKSEEGRPSKAGKR